MMRSFKFWFLTPAVLLLGACEREAPRPDFRAALDAHIAAIEAKDLEAYKPTVTSGDDLMIIFPEGQTIDGTADVVAFHKEWFGDANWRMAFTVEKLMEGDDMSAALLKYDYRDTTDGEPRSAWLLLIFKLEDGEWRLVHDQNTRIAQNTNSESE